LYSLYLLIFSKSKACSEDMSATASKPQIDTKTNDWFMRVGDGINFNNSKYYIWGG